MPNLDGGVVPQMVNHCTAFNDRYMMFFGFYCWKIKLLYLFLHLLIQIWSQNHNCKDLNVFLPFLFIILQGQWMDSVFADRSLNQGRVCIGEVDYEVNTSTIGWKEANVCRHNNWLFSSYDVKVCQALKIVHSSDDLLTKRLKSRYNINKISLFYSPKFELFLVFSFWVI